ncbi:sigma factor-like helix-turn-helix DNA-binding protein [Microbulbifer taiwanensis]|uniref:sigma factor-like helix-turn-helix DNA-binding protein n=1 Tax=Microbulbifer taiwanensis TaxID=986746 RepID=UPI00361940A8
MNLVARALGELPERTRRVFELYRMGGHTQREIAKMLGVSPTLVNFMIRDALNHCRSALESAS